MSPVRRLSPAAAIAATVLAGAALTTATSAQASAAAAAGCTPGAITTTAPTSDPTATAAARTFVCDRHDTPLEVSAAPVVPITASAATRSGGAPIARAAASSARCELPRRNGRTSRMVSAGRTLVVITTVRDAATRTVRERRSTPYICAADAAWRQVSDPLAGVTLIPTSITIDRTELTR